MRSGCAEELLGQRREAGGERVHVLVLKDLLAYEPQALLEGQVGERLEERPVERSRLRGSSLTSLAKAVAPVAISAAALAV